MRDLFLFCVSCSNRIWLGYPLLCCCPASSNKLDKTLAFGFKFPLYCKVEVWSTRSWRFDNLSLLWFTSRRLLRMTMRLSAEVVKVLTDMDNMDKASYLRIADQWSSSDICYYFQSLSQMCNVHVQDNISSASSWSQWIHLLDQDILHQLAGS